MRKGNPWYGMNGGSARCPFPGCGHVGSIITKIHCRLEHRMERDELGELYGFPTMISPKFKKGRKSNA